VGARTLVAFIPMQLTRQETQMAPRYAAHAYIITGHRNRPKTPQRMSLRSGLRKVILFSTIRVPSCPAGEISELFVNIPDPSQCREAVLGYCITVRVVNIVYNTIV
jgi:hypothetical protein